VSSTTIRFEKVQRRRSALGTCPGCGRFVQRRKTFEQTVNPFNRNADGSVKTRDEVSEAVKAEAAAWVPDFTHEACRTVS
jgi:hypothetical protein